MSVVNAMIARGFNPGAGRLEGDKARYSMNRDEQIRSRNAFVQDRSFNAQQSHRNAMVGGQQDAAEAEHERWIMGQIQQAKTPEQAAAIYQWGRADAQKRGYDVSGSPEELPPGLYVPATPKLIKGADGTMVPETPGAEFHQPGPKPPAPLNPLQEAQLTALKRKEQGEIDETALGKERSGNQLKLAQDAMAKAKKYSGASGRSLARRGVEATFAGATDYTNLETAIDTLKTSLMTLWTDPAVKKFFGPQMSNADVRLMQAGGSMLDPEKQSPEEMANELERLEGLMARMTLIAEGGAPTEVPAPTTIGGAKVTFKE